MNNNISDIKLIECKNSKFITLNKMLYKQDGVQKSWDIAKVHDSVSVLIYNKDTSSFIVVKQFRPALYLKNGIGFSYELCAGIIDKDKSLEQIAIEEVEEECGYKIKNI